MRKDIIKKLLCPKCKNTNLELVSLKRGIKDIIEGRILCEKCNSSYVITDGIVRFVAPKDDLWDNEWRKRFNPNENKKLISTALKNKETLISYVPIAKLAIRNKIDVKDSIEIGCGSGTYSLLLKKLGIIKNPAVVDTSIQALYGLKRLFNLFNEECSPVLANGKCLPFKNKSFSLSLSGGLIEHFKQKDQQTIIHEHCRCAENVLCQAPLNSISYWIFRYIFTLHNSLRWPYGFERPLSTRDFKELFEREKYNVTDIAYHDVLTSIFFVKFTHLYEKIPPKIKFLMPKFFKKEIVIYAREFYRCFAE